MKKKANSVRRARVAARGFEQIDGMHYDSSSIAALVTNKLIIRIIMVLALMADWSMKIVDVKGSFLHGEMMPIRCISKCRKGLRIFVQELLFSKC
jgi:hypothetical protein